MPMSSFSHQQKPKRLVPTSSVTPIVREVLQTSGEHLDRKTELLMESRIGHDFSQVRVHTDRKAGQAAQEIGARAFASGQDIVFGEGQYKPATKSGQELIAHELVHTVQQSRAPAQPCPFVSFPSMRMQRQAVDGSCRVASHGLSRIPVRAENLGTGSQSDFCPLPARGGPRACPFGGACHTCPARIQTKRAVEQPGDAYEQEADRIADHVARQPAGFSPPAQIEHAPRRISETPAVVREVLGSPGRPLEPAARAVAQSCLGHGFGRVRVHTDDRAGESARAVRARAYAFGSHIVFNHGQYAPLTSEGRRLLVHELAHVVQQTGDFILCAPDPKALEKFDKRLAALRKHPVYIKVTKNSEVKTAFEKIVSAARKRDDPLYYVAKLELLFNTPEVKPEEQAAENAAALAAAAGKESKRLAPGGEGAKRKGVEEKIAKDPSRSWIKVKRKGGNFEIDARDLSNIVVRVNVRLVAAGKGTKEDVGHVEQLEDAIEKFGSTLGYTVDINFIGPSAKLPEEDVFTLEVDTAGWTTSGNWVGTAAGLAHELHHLLGLPDYYDYIERHAGNPKATYEQRIVWFSWEMEKKPEPETGLSIMGKSTTGTRNLPSDRDVCHVAAGGKKTIFDECLKKRAEARAEKLRPAISDASAKTWRVFNLISGLKPLSLAEPAEMHSLKLKLAATRAKVIFGNSVALPDLAEIVAAMRHVVADPHWLIVSELSPECGRIAFSEKIFPQIRLCPAFFSLGTEAQSDLLLREAAHCAGEGDSKDDAPCSGEGCLAGCGDRDNGEAWVRFIKCVSDI